jgi:hypothetical protein
MIDRVIVIVIVIVIVRVRVRVRVRMRDWDSWIHNRGTGSAPMLHKYPF